jgi:5-dehydro-2-deoxygluconokinase
MRVFAFDHRMQLEAIADEAGAPATASARSRSSASRRCRRSPAGRPGYGLLCDGRLGRDALYAAAGTGLWIGRPVELPGSRPLRLEDEIEPDYGSALAEWPLEHVVKVLAFYHPDDDAAMKADQEATVLRLAAPAAPTGSSSCSRSSRPRSPPSPTPPPPRSSSASTTSASIPTGGSSSR